MLALNVNWYFGGRYFFYDIVYVCHVVDTFFYVPEKFHVFYKENKVVCIKTAHEFVFSALGGKMFSKKL